MNFEQEAYKRCYKCRECLKMIMFTEILVSGVSLLFILAVFMVSVTKT